MYQSLFIVALLLFSSFSRCLVLIHLSSVVRYLTLCCFACTDRSGTIKASWYVSKSLRCCSAFNLSLIDTLLTNQFALFHIILTNKTIQQPKHDAGKYWNLFVLCFVTSFSCFSSAVCFVAAGKLQKLAVKVEHHRDNSPPAKITKNGLQEGSKEDCRQPPWKKVKKGQSPHELPSSRKGRGGNIQPTKKPRRVKRKERSCHCLVWRSCLVTS